MRLKTHPRSERIPLDNAMIGTEATLHSEFVFPRNVCAIFLVNGNISLSLLVASLKNLQSEMYNISFFPSFFLPLIKIAHPLINFLQASGSPGTGQVYPPSRHPPSRPRSHFSSGLRPTSRLLFQPPQLAREFIILRIRSLFNFFFPSFYPSAPLPLVSLFLFFRATCTSAPLEVARFSMKKE